MVFQSLSNNINLLGTPTITYLFGHPKLLIFYDSLNIIWDVILVVVVVVVVYIASCKKRNDLKYL